MKITILRDSSVVNNQLVQFSENGKVEPYENGTFAGVAEDCRQVSILEDLNSDVETIYDICSLITSGPAIARLSGTAPQNGSDAFINGPSVSSTGTNKIGSIIAKAWPNTGDYSDGDLVNVVLK